MKSLTLKKSLYSVPLAFLLNLVMVFVVYFLCRLAYLFENWTDMSAGFDSLSFKSAFCGSLKFDASAILYTNLPYALLMLIPLHLKENGRWQSVAKWLFILLNSVCVIINVSDAVYFKYTGRRTTSSVFQEFSHEGNLGGVFGVELANHWYLVLFSILVIALLCFAYVKPSCSKLSGKIGYLKYYALHLVCLLVFIPLAICGMRGGATKAVRPITISNANQYVNRPAEAALILNTPFSLIRTVNKNVFADPKFMPDDEMNRIYSPVFYPSDSVKFKSKNVVILIMESYGREYIGSLNKSVDGGNYKGFTPFTDSLIAHSLTFEYSFANGRKSIDGMPSILSGIPRFIEPFFLTPASMNSVSSVAGELAKKGYYTAFFHGAENGSMGFEAFAKASGYQDYFGRTEYKQDSRFNGDKDFDGMWAIWDEEFLKFYALKMNEMKQPFVTSVFTASSHHPYVVPERYKNIYLDEPGDGNIMHKCIRYVDNSLRKFFDLVKTQDWYKNTIFVITADHTNLNSLSEYRTDLGAFSVPIIIFDPSGDIKPDYRHCVAQQIDIMPTILNYLGYDNPYVSFGKDLFNTPDDSTWAVNNSGGIYQFVKGDYVIQTTDNGKLKAVYNYKKDWFMSDNLIGKCGNRDNDMQTELKAIIQSYMQRMTQNRLVYSAENN